MPNKYPERRKEVVRNAVMRYRERKKNEIGEKKRKIVLKYLAVCNWCLLENICPAPYWKERSPKYCSQHIIDIKVHSEQ